MKNLGLVGVAMAALAMSGCGGGGSSPAPAPAPTASPSPAPVIGSLAVAWTNAGPVDPLPVPGPQLLNSNGSSAAPPAASAAPGQSITFAASQSNNTTGFSAALSGTGCAAPTVTLSATTSTTGTFTVATTAAAAPATCTLTVSAATGTPVATTITILTKGAIALLWTAPGITLQTAPPYAGSIGPVVLIGSGVALATNLYSSEPNYIGSYTATVTCPAGSSGVQVSTIGGTAGATATSATGAFAVSATAVAVSPPSNECTIAVTDATAKAATPPIGVALNITTGIVQ